MNNKIYLDIEKDSTLAKAILKAIADYNCTQGLNVAKIEFIPTTLSRSHLIEVLVQDYKYMEDYKETAQKYNALESAVKQMKKVWDK